MAPRLARYARCSTGASEVLVVTRAGQPDGLIPMIHDVVQQLDIAGNRIVVRLLEGLLETREQS